jgi:hypothetical protein
VIQVPVEDMFTVEVEQEVVPQDTTLYHSPAISEKEVQVELLQECVAILDSIKSQGLRLEELILHPSFRKDKTVKRGWVRSFSINASRLMNRLKATPPPAPAVHAVCELTQDKQSLIDVAIPALMSLNLGASPAKQGKRRKLFGKRSGIGKKKRMLSVDFLLTGANLEEIQVPNIAWRMLD